MLFIEALIAGIVMIITDKTIFGIFTFGLCLFFELFVGKGQTVLTDIAGIFEDNMIHLGKR